MRPSRLAVWLGIVALPTVCLAYSPMPPEMRALAEAQQRVTRKEAKLAVQSAIYALGRPTTRLQVDDPLAPRRLTVRFDTNRILNVVLSGTGVLVESGVLHPRAKKETYRFWDETSRPARVLGVGLPGVSLVKGSSGLLETGRGHASPIGHCGVEPRAYSQIRVLWLTLGRAH